MIRIFSILVGAFFSLALLLAFGTGAYNQLTDPPAKPAEKIFGKHPRHLALASDGWFGKFDRQLATEQILVDPVVGPAQQRAEAVQCRAEIARRMKFCV